jgi:Holliday junction resolvasome RuvABC DNA-binding subunit
MTLFIIFVIGLFVGLLISHGLNRAILKNTERFCGEMSSYLEELVKYLKKKYEPSVKDSQENPKTSKKNGNGEVKQALLALKFSASEADKAIESLPEGLAIEEQVKQALKVLLK